MIRVLAIYYSQTGQLGRALDAFLGGLDPERFDVTKELLRPDPGHAFPWSVGRFFDAMPETVAGDPGPIARPTFDPDADWDLIVLGYTVWFLAPSLPVQGFFESDAARVLAGKPVITLCACRNMWHTASERMKGMIAAAGGRHVDNVVVVDQGPPWATFVTTPRWMFTGKSDAFWFFPAAGVDAQDISGLDRFGRALSQRLRPGEGIPAGPLLTGLGAVEVNSRFILPELIGRFSFLPWAHVIRAAGRLGAAARRVALWLFVVYLTFAILVLIPLSILVRIVLYPFLRGWMRSYTIRLLSPTGG